MSDQKSFFEGLQTILSERVNSPLWSTFAITWSIWNFSFFIVLFSSMSAAEKIYAIKNEVFKFSFEWPECFYLMENSMNGIVMPAFLTTLVILANPFFKKWAYTWTHAHEVDLKNEKHIIDKEEFFTAKERDELLDRIAEQRANNKNAEETINKLKVNENEYVQKLTDSTRRMESLQQELQNRDYRNLTDEEITNISIKKIIESFIEENRLAKDPSVNRAGLYLQVSARNEKGELKSISYDPPFQKQGQTLNDYIAELKERLTMDLPKIQN